MRALKTLLIILLSVASAGAVIGLLGPRHTEVSGQVYIKAPPALIFAHVAPLRHAMEWMPWTPRDTNAKVTMGGNHEGVGQVATWDADHQAGKGSIAVVALVPNERVEWQGQVQVPWKTAVAGAIALLPSGDSTRVTWTTSTANDFLGRLYVMFNDVQLLLRPEVDAGLARLKQLAEEEARVKQAEEAARTFRGLLVDEGLHPEIQCIGLQRKVPWTELDSFLVAAFHRSAVQLDSARIQRLETPAAVLLAWDTAHREVEVLAGWAARADSTAMPAGLARAHVAAGKVLLTSFLGPAGKMRDAHAAVEDMIGARGMKERGRAFAVFSAFPGSPADTARWAVQVIVPVE